jgi:hypothetical protein
MREKKNLKLPYSENRALDKIPTYRRNPKYFYFSHAL